MPDIVGIRFHRMERLFYFDPAGIPVKVGDLAVADGGKGPELGRVVVAPSQVISSEVAGPLKPMLRLATDQDTKQAQANIEKERVALTLAREMVGRHRLPLKLINAETNLEGSRFTIHFTAEGRVDFRELVRELSSSLKARVELRQVGPRDETKLLGGLGPCGLALCCSSHLTEFTPVSIRMAKEQELSLNPTKISGVCGRLLCCLAYEIEQYRQIKARLPRKGQSVQTPLGPAVVVWTNALTETILVQLESQAVVEYPASQVTPLAQTQPATPEETD